MELAGCNSALRNLKLTKMAKKKSMEARMDFIKTTENNNFVGYINVAGEPAKYGNLVTPMTDLYFIRLTSADESQKGVIEDLTLMISSSRNPRRTERPSSG